MMANLNKLIIFMRFSTILKHLENIPKQIYKIFHLYFHLEFLNETD